MAARRRPLKRRLGERRYRRLFVIATEGAKTEPAYFGLFNDEQSVIHVKCLRSGHASAPPQVLARMEQHLRQEALRETDQAWLVVDTDRWTDSQLKSLYQWTQKAANRGLAVSNPHFEFWLLLHFEEGEGLKHAKDCARRLKHYLPGYDKGLSTATISLEMVSGAIARAMRRDKPACTDWPRSLGQTTVYRLVKEILQRG
jgi:hypothetical protein